jgi:hypothetical protein
MLSKIHGEILEPVGYEWWMFRSTDDWLACLHETYPKPDSEPHVVVILTNAMIESRAVHGRALAQCFYVARPGQRTSFGSRSSDLTIKDLGLALEPLPDAVDAWCFETNKRIAHLTGERLVPQPGWETTRVKPLFEARIQEITRHFGSDMPSDWVGEHATGGAPVTLHGAYSVSVPTAMSDSTASGGRIIPAWTGKVP